MIPLISQPLREVYTLGTEAIPNEKNTLLRSLHLLKSLLRIPTDEEFNPVPRFTIETYSLNPLSPLQWHIDGYGRNIRANSWASSLSFFPRRRNGRLGDSLPLCLHRLRLRCCMLSCSTGDRSSAVRVGHRIKDVRGCRILTGTTPPVRFY